VKRDFLYEWKLNKVEPSDGEVLGIDEDGCLVQYDADNGTAYNCGETLDEFGIDNLTQSERDRIRG
jgi:hypothetical protein